MLTPYPWQQKQWQRLTEAAGQARLPHALLLTGAGGMGINEFVRAITARLLCEQVTDDYACGECRSCLLFQPGNHPDIMRIEPEEPGKAIKVDAIRTLIDYIHLSSQYGRYKIAVIEPAEALNRHAANSLLKTLEEPPSQSILILNSRRPSQLPVTIRSRCQQINFPAPPVDTARAWLAEQLQGDTGRAAELLAMARNRPLTALHLEEDGSVEQQDAVLTDLEQLQSEITDPVMIARRWLGHDPDKVMQWLLAFIQIMERQKLIPAGTEGTDSYFHERLLKLAGGLDLRQLIKWYDIVLDNYRAATGPFNLNQQGLLEDIIVNWQALSQTAIGGTDSERSRRT